MVQRGLCRSTFSLRSDAGALLFAAVAIEEDTPADTPRGAVSEAVLLVAAVLLSCLLRTIAQDWDSHSCSNGPQYCVIISERLHNWIKMCWYWDFIITWETTEINDFKTCQVLFIPSSFLSLRDPSQFTHLQKMLTYLFYWLHFFMPSEAWCSQSQSPCPLQPPNIWKSGSRTLN